MPPNEEKARGGATGSATEASWGSWDVATSRRKRAQRVAAQHSSDTVWKTIRQNCSHLLTVAAKVGCKYNCLLEALVFEALATTPNFEPFSATSASTNERYLNGLAFAEHVGDVETFLNVMRGWTNPSNRGRDKQGTRGASTWCAQKGINESKLKLIEKKVQDSYTHLCRLAPRQFFPQLRFDVYSKDASVGLCWEIISEALAHSVCVYSGDESLGYVEIVSGDAIKISPMSVLSFMSPPPKFVAIIDPPNVSREKRYFVVLPDEDAKTMIEKITGEVAKDVIERTVPHPLVISNVGSALLKRLEQHLEVDGSLRKTLEDVCGSAHCVVKTDKIHNVLKATCFKKHHSAVEAAVKDFIEAEREQLRQESLVINYPSPGSKLSLAVSGGASCRCPFKSNEFISLAVRYTSYKEISLTNVEETFKDYDVTVQEKGGPKSEGSRWGVVTFKNSEEANKAHREVYSDLFILDPCFPKASCGKLASAQLKQTIVIEVAWVGLQQGDKVSTDIVQFRKELEDSLADLSGNKWTCAVYFTKDASRPYGAKVTTSDCTTAMRALSFLRDAKICGRHLEICNSDEVHKQLRSFTIDLDVKVYTAVKDVLWSRLANFMRQPANKMECKEVEGDKTRCKLVVSCADPHVAKHVMAKLEDTVKPKKFSHTQQYVPLLPVDRDVLLEKIMAETKAFIEVDELHGRLHLYGSKTTRKAAEKLLRTHVLNSRKWFIVNLFSDNFTYDAIVRLIQHTTKAELEDNFKVDALEINPTEGYILHRSDRFWMNSIQDKNVRKKLKFLEKDNSAEKECVACFTAVGAAEAYILEGCGHSYCLQCLQTQIQTSLSNTIFPLHCASCDAAFVIQDLVNISGPLKLFTLSTIFKGSLRSFVNSNAKRYRCCPHLSCEGIVDLSCQGDLRCSLCSRKICEDCFEIIHKEYTCEEFGNTKKILIDWIKENPKQRKQCPSCEIGIEKVEGCDNVYCTACKRYVCWQCMAYFVDADDCYDHLDDEHEGV